MVHPFDQGWEELSKNFAKMAGARQIFELDIDLVQTSCGTGVPVMNVGGQRGPTELLPFYEDLGEDGVKAYWARKNRFSIDLKETGIEGTVDMIHEQIKK